MKCFVETTPHLCVYKETCKVELPHVDDYENCTVDKYNDAGTNEIVPIDQENNCIYLKRTPRALNATYILSCQKGDYQIYSHLQIEIRGKRKYLNVFQANIQLQD